MKRAGRVLQNFLSVHTNIVDEITKYQIKILEHVCFLSACADAEGRRYIQPSQRYVAVEVGCSAKTVQRAFDNFADMGLVAKEWRKPLSWNEWRTNRYQINEALMKWARKKWAYLTSRTFMSTYPSKKKNSGKLEGKKTLREDSSHPIQPPGEPPGRLTALTLSIIHPKPTRGHHAT